MTSPELMVKDPRFLRPSIEAALLMIFTCACFSGMSAIIRDLASEISPDLASKMVFVTGDTSSVSGRNFLGATTNPVLSKPFDMSEVRRLIESFS